MRKVVLFLLLAFGLSAMSQQTIYLRSTDKAECLKSDMTILKASFSFSTIEAQDYESERGVFSWLSLPNTVIGGNEGDPQIPVVNELIAVPLGTYPRIEITSYSTTDYRLEDYGIHTLVPRQPSLRKDQRPEDVPFLYNEAAYQTRGFRSKPMAVVNVVGTMRGVQLGKMTIEPVSYDPVSNIMRVFNDIEVTVHFDDADPQATEQMLVDTYSPYFEGIYNMLFNGRSIRSVYDDHPDLYTTPVKMLVVTTSTYANSTAFQNWLTWKKQKGINVDVQTVSSSTSSADIRSLIQSKYNANHPTFLVIVGDETAVTYYTTYNVSGLTCNPYVSDLQYASIDNDIYHDMFMSRMSVSSTTELGYLVDKTLMYEKYTMPDPSYLNNVLLIAGADNTWAPKVGRPTINYAANNYFNTAHGFTNVYKYVSNNYTGCYNYLSSGVGFANYTAHGDIQEWYKPKFTNSNVNSLTNTNKYFWAMGNCCLTSNFGNTNTYPCLGEALIRAQDKGAFGYIGSVPETYWWEDYYFGVGATSVHSQTPSMSQTQIGVYDFMFDDTQMNTLNSVPFAGNVAVSYAHANNYSSTVSDEYYWRAYQCFGDGSVMPYLAQPAANEVSHDSTISIGADIFTVSAVAGSYVSITKDNEILGVAEVPSSGTVNVPIERLASFGDVMIVVTRQQRQPYITTIPVVQYTITATANPTDAGTITGAGYFYENTICTLTAIPNSGWDFVNWDDGNTENPRSFTVTEDASFTANFTAVPERNITLASVMYGTISSDHTTAYKNDLVTLTATPDSSYNLESWVVFKTGDVNTTVTVNGNTFIMPDYDVTVSAIFSKPTNVEVTIGSGTGTDAGSDLPTNVYYNYCLSQQIYTAEEVGSAGNITQIGFYYNSSINAGVRNLQIYMSHTSSSAITSWVTQSDSNLVYSGSYIFSQGWNTIPLTTPFAYDGTSNLLLTVDDNTGSYSVNQYIYFYTYPTGANRAIYFCNDNINPSPTGNNSNNAAKVQNNAQIKITKEMLDAGYLSVSPTNLNGFNALVNGPASEPQSIAVIGSNLQANLTITAPEGFEISTTSNGDYSDNLILTPSNGSLCTNVFVRLSSNLDFGDYNGDLTLTSGTTTATISLSGTVNSYVVTVTPMPAEGGSVTLGGIFHYGESCTVTAIPNEGYAFINWTEEDEVVSTETTYNFEVTSDRNLVAHFAPLHTLNLTQGWNWFSSNIEITLEQLQDALVAALPGSSITIKSKAHGTSIYNGTTWRGQLSSFDVTQMYKIFISTDSQITLAGASFIPTEHTITIENGANWIGFPLSESISIKEAFSEFPVNGDMVKSKNGVATFNGTIWRGSLSTLEPGEGYIYMSNVTTSRTFTFPTNPSK